ncbi:MAG: hypothetical protein JXQ83_14670, partial [Candidatus Glassbacteria bacterium]|nr:hypothetical protein [Candidatus Glassbacteria bacterium]
NGETVFNQAVRSMVNGSGGKRFTIQPGEVLVFQNQLAADSSWKTNNCEIVAFVQQVVSREILQAERRTFPELGLAEPGPVLAVTCDFNGDGKVSVSDVIALLLFQRANPGDLRGDFNRDGKVSVTDAIAMLLAQRDNTCP